MNCKKTLFIVSSSLFLISGSVYADFLSSFKAGRTAALQKQYDAALENYLEAEKQTTAPEQRFLALRAAADVYRLKGDWKNAEDTLVRILEDKTISAQYRMSAQNRMGDYKLKQKRIEEAVAEYQKTAAYGIENNESHYALLSCGNLFLQQKKYDDAEKCFRRLADNPQVDPSRKVRAQIGMGNLFLQQKKYDDAEKCFRRLADDPQVDPSFKARAQIGMGNVLFNQGKYQETVTLLNGIAKDSEGQNDLRANALTIIARSYYKMKAYKEAYETNMAVIALNNIPAYFKAAAYMQAISIQEGALKDYAQAKKLLDDFEKMPGVNASQQEWIKTHRAKIDKTEHSI